jgi:NAD(P)-dependent dehydrogenase (short-subunit alcohol dehydrogenase family)
MCEGRVCIVSGGGRGIGREHALLLGGEGARVVVNDIGVRRDGVPESSDAAQAVTDEIHGLGGEAMANTDDVSTMAGASRLVDQALSAWGRLDVIVNNAGILRDRMLVNMTEDDWDAVMAVHLRSTYLLSHLGVRHWRERVKEGERNDARIVNTTSASGIYGNVGQTNYGAAKAAIAAFTVIASMEVARYGVTVNAVCPTALTRMTEDLEMARSDEAQAGALHPRWASPVVVWLASPQSADVTGRVFVASGRHLAVAEGWVRGPTTAPVSEPGKVDGAVRPLLAAARPNSDMRGAPMYHRGEGT